nr:thioesterase [uncultured bacterium]
MTIESSYSKWFVIPVRNPTASVRLFCFPYAGGTASVFTGWSRDLPPSVELVAVQLPGRANRMFEPAHTTMRAAVADLCPAMRTLIDKPYVLLGHSLGSRIAFELARELRRRGERLPVHFISSGSRAPHLRARDRIIHPLPREAFMAELRDFNGTPPSVLENEELMDLYLPLLRADFELAETYSPDEEPPLDCFLSIFSGDRDKDIEESDLLAWRRHFANGGEITLFPEDHFFIDKLRQPVLARLNHLLRRVVAEIASSGAHSRTTA